MSKITQEDRDRVLDMLRQGMIVRDIAAATGHTKPSIAAIAKQYGIIPARRQTIADCDEIIMRMVGEGKTRREIADAIGYSPKTVYDYLRQKRRDEQDPVELEYSKLIFAEPKRINISRVECGGKAYMDVTDLYCPG